MSKAKTETKMDSFQSWAHRWGRVGTLIVLIYMVALPFVVLAAYDSIPSLGEVFNVNTFSILLIYIPVGFSEALSYTPILGCSAYLAFLTGNIMNLKLPVAANAMNLTKKQPNTPEGEAIASVAVAVSSLMTVAILTLAAVCASFISPVFELPAVKTASGYLLPALFGSMALGLFASSSSGSKVVKGGIKGVLPVLIIMTVLSLAARLAYNSSSTLVCTYPACINRELYDALPESDIRRGLFLDPLEYTYNTGGITNNGLGGSALTSYAQGLYPDLNTSAKVYAYMSFKFKCIDKVGAMPFNLFRSSEMYLIEAEANCHLTPPKEAEARQLLKELIRDSGRDPQYTCDKSGQALLDEIKFYRRIELWGEGFSWFDFKRRKDTIVRHTFDMTNAAITINPEDANNWMWVIPAKEYEYNNAINKQ